MCGLEIAIRIFFEKLENQVKLDHLIVNHLLKEGLTVE